MSVPCMIAESDALVDVQEWDARAELIQTPCGEGQMVWRSWGHGPTVLLLHGGAGSWRHWIRTLPALADRFRVLAPDLPGLGDSALPPQPWTPDVSSTILAEGLESILDPRVSFDVVGFSAGAMLAGLLAARFGARCTTLVLVGARGLGTAREPVLLEKVRTKQGEARWAAHRGNLARLMLAQPAAIDAQALAIQDWNTVHTRVNSVGFAETDILLDALGTVRARIKAIWGEEDAVARTTLAERCAVLRRIQPEADIRIIPAAGHWVAYEAAETFNKTLVAMLGGDPIHAEGSERDER